ncbi:MAG: DUF5666 domain-containing protein [Chloroflexota bacterium]|nr:DUF5666 domain-containing protein [Chloroflexota bacterium]
MRSAFVVSLIAAIVVGGIVGGVFVGGVAMGKEQGREEASLELREQMSQFTSPFGQQIEDSSRRASIGSQEGMNLPNMGGFSGGAGTMGTVESVEQGVITLSTLEGSISVLTGNSTFFQTVNEGSLGDVSVGENVTVSGEQQEDGTIQATAVYMIPNFMRK